jgi:hypothetical protein
LGCPSFTKAGPAFCEVSLPQILQDYPSEFQKHVFLEHIQPIGNFMDYMGTIPRYFNPKEPDHFDEVVKSYIFQRGEDLSQYSDYGVVPKRLGDSYKSAKRYDLEPDPLSDETKLLYDTALSGLSLSLETISLAPRSCPMSR